MRKLIFSTVLSLLLSQGSLLADINNKVLDEVGINLQGQCKAIAPAPNNSLYVLLADNQILNIDVDGSQTTIKLPDMTKNLDGNYYCDMAVDKDYLYLCANNLPYILKLDLKNPSKFEHIDLKFNGSEINPLMISKYKDLITIKDSNFATYKINKEGQLSILPENSDINVDKNFNAIIQEMPFDTGKDKIIYPGKLLNEDGSLRFKAPTPDSPKVVMGLEYLGYNSDSDQDIYIVNTASGELDANLTVYAVNNSGKIVNNRPIPNSTIYTLMRFCKLAQDKSIIAAYADPMDEEKVIIKKFEFKSTKITPKG